jgi:hypothetical protein
MAMLKTDPTEWYVAVETASITLAGPYEFITVREGERRRGDDPILKHAAQFFLPEAMPPEQRAPIVSERRTAETKALRAEERRREEEARQQTADRTEAERAEAKRRQVVVFPPYEGEMTNPLSERARHPMAHLATGIVNAMQDDAA